MKAFLHWLPVALGVAFLLSLAYLQRDRALRGENDFAQLYAGAKLAGTPNLYSRAANLAAVKAELGFTMDSVVYTRPPFYAVLLKPLAWLPYRVAYVVFSLATLSSVLWFVIRFSQECSAVPFFAAMSIPVLAALCGGQDTPFLLVILGTSILLTRQNRDYLAGLVLALCAIKFHLFLFIPLLLLLKQRWRILGGAITGTVLLTVLGIWAGGPGVMAQYGNVLRDPWINPSVAVMPNLHGLVATLQGDLNLELVFAAIVLGTFLWTTLQSESYEFLFAASLVGSLLVSFHSGVADDLVLFPAFVSVIRTSSNVPLRAAAALILTPVPYFMVLAGEPYNAFLPIALILLLGLFWAARGCTLRAALIAGETSCASGSQVTAN